MFGEREILCAAPAPGTRASATRARCKRFDTENSIRRFEGRNMHEGSISAKQQKKRPPGGGLSTAGCCSVHPTHAAARRTGRGGLVFLPLDHDALGGEQEA